MSLHYIIDGYNALHTSRRWVDVPREQQREKFLKYLDDKGVGSARNTLTVVLDGYAAKLQDLVFQRLRLIFSGDRDADSVIKDYVEEMANPKDAIVVTDDRSIQKAVKAMGAHVMACDEYYRSRQEKKPVRRRAKLDAAAEESVNRELKRLWKLE